MEKMCNTVFKANYLNELSQYYSDLIVVYTKPEDCVLFLNFWQFQKFSFIIKYWYVNLKYILKQINNYKLLYHEKTQVLTAAEKIICIIFLSKI